MTENANDSALTTNDIDQILLQDELHQSETLSHQRFRPVYRNAPYSSTSTPDQDVFSIVPEFDPELERDVVYWKYIVEKFEDVLFLKNNSIIVEFIQDCNSKILEPFRINVVPGVTLDVVIENPIDDTRTSTTSTAITAIEDSSANGSGGDESINIGNTNISKPSQSTDRSCIQNSDDFNTLQCISWIRGRGLTLTKAERGNAEAQTDIAIIYSYFLKDYTKAMEWSHKAANQGYPPAQSIIGQLYGMGHGVSKDLSMAWRWYMKAAEQNDPVGQNGIGSMYQNGQVVAKDNSMAAEWYLKAADQGHAGAQRNLGSLYTEGLGVPKDYSKALEWFIKASNQGDILAQNDIGHIYQNGTGVPQNYPKALWRYQRAAEFGDQEGQLNMGRMYEEGLGTKRDYDKAMEWYFKAANQGNRTAKERIANLYRIMGKFSKSLKWYLGIADEEDVKIMHAIGELYLRYLKSDHSKALEWFLKASNKGHIMSQLTLASMYYDGLGTTRDLTESFKWYHKAALQNSSLAQFHVGFCYFNGIGVPLDYDKALEMISMAEKRGGLFGGRVIPLFYEYGYGVPVDFKEAKNWYKYDNKKRRLISAKEKKRVF